MENLLEVQVPEDIERQLQQQDRQEQSSASGAAAAGAMAPEMRAEGAAPT